MTLLPLTDCCLLLGIDPKTLRLWLKAAHLCWTVHPSDARLKCLTQPQLQHLATLHGRVLPESLPSTASTAAPQPATAEPPGASPGSASCTEPSAQADLQRQLTCLHTQVATLQEQVTHLALALLREREWRWEARLSQAQAPLPTSATTLPVARQARPDTSPSRLNAPAPKPAAAPSSPTRSRARSRALPLIEYGADGRYLAICPTRGVLPLIPDSPAWFDWLASLTAFTFQGANGRFSTTCKVRKDQRAHAWSAYRSLHGRSCNLYLGLTSHLTLAHLEQMAATIQSHLTTF
jgi:hypothetical protein